MLSKHSAVIYSLVFRTLSGVVCNTWFQSMTENESLHKKDLFRDTPVRYLGMVMDLNQLLDLIYVCKQLFQYMADVTYMFTVHCSDFSIAAPCRSGC